MREDELRDRELQGDAGPTSGGSLSAPFRAWCIAGAALFWVAMFIGTHIPKVPDALQDVSDKTMHFVAYGGLAFLLALTSAAFQQVSWRRYLWVLAIASAYGVLDEVLQIPVGRHADVQDWIADTTGAVCGLFLFALLRRTAHALQRPRLFPKIEQ